MKEIPYSIKIYDNVMEITPDVPITDNAVYEIFMDQVRAMNTLAKLTDIHEKVYTRMTPAYCSLEGVKSLVESIDLPDDKTLYYIREASRKADYLAGTSFDEENPPFQVNQFVKYRSAYDTLLRYSIDRASQAGYKGVMGEIQFETSDSENPLKGILASLKLEADKWELDLQSDEVRRGAKPKAVVKSKANIYATRVSGFGREVT